MTDSSIPGTTPPEEMRKYFERTIADYDTVAEHVVMANDVLHQELIGTLPFAVDEPIRVLDLGSGTGHGMALVTDRFPHALVVGVDFAEKMNRQATAKLKGRVATITADFREPSLLVGEQFDAVISAVAIHNVSDAEKATLFSRVYGWLRPGGVFANGDFVAGETPNIDRLYREIYRRYLETHLTGDELAVWTKHAFEQDMPMALTAHYNHLAAIGFERFDLRWQLNNEAVYSARKPVRP